MSRLKSPITGNKDFAGSSFKTLDVPNEDPNSIDNMQLSNDQLEVMKAAFKNRGIPFDESMMSNPNPVPAAAAKFLNQQAQANPAPINNLRDFNEEEYFGKKQEAPKMMNTNIRKRIESLLGKRTTKEVILDEKSFVLQTLTNKESRDVIKSLAKFDGSFELGFEVRRQNLARSLIKMERL